VRAWLLRRLLLAVPTLLGITLVTFALSRLAPGGPLSAQLDTLEGKPISTADKEAMNQLLGLDRPLPEQYATWLGRFVRLDFGESLAPGHEPVRTKIAEAFGVSVALQAIALLLMYGIGLPLGLFCAAKAGTRLERAIAAGLFLVHSTPVLLLGTVLVALFCTGALARLPMLGLRTPGVATSGFEAFADVARHAVLPIVCLTLSHLAGVTRYARAGVLEALRQPYIHAARARGLPERRLLTRHALRNGLVPTITLLAGNLAWLVGGSVAIETFFGLPGLGRLSIDSILLRDYPTVMALSVLVGAAMLLGFLLTDLLYVVVSRRAAPP
jgi:peptide/nickel transport system permease protein